MKYGNYKNLITKVVIGSLMISTVAMAERDPTDDDWRRANSKSTTGDFGSFFRGMGESTSKLRDQVKKDLGQAQAKLEPTYQAAVSYAQQAKDRVIGREPVGQVIEFRYPKSEQDHTAYKAEMQQHEKRLTLETRYLQNEHDRLMSEMHKASQHTETRDADWDLYRKLQEQAQRKQQELTQKSAELERVKKEIAQTRTLLPAGEVSAHTTQVKDMSPQELMEYYYSTALRIAKTHCISKKQLDEVLQRREYYSDSLLREMRSSDETRIGHWDNFKTNMSGFNYDLLQKFQLNGRNGSKCGSRAENFPATHNDREREGYHDRDDAAAALANLLFLKLNQSGKLGLRESIIVAETNPNLTPAAKKIATQRLLVGNPIPLRGLETVANGSGSTN